MLLIGKRKGLYFNDGVRRIDFVIVYEKQRSAQQQNEIETYLSNLKQKGIQMELDEGVKYTDKVFVKLHAPNQFLTQLAYINNVILSMEKDRSIPKYSRNLLHFKNLLNLPPNPRAPIYKRLPYNAKGLSTKQLTTRERILLINYLLTRTDYGPRTGDYGLHNLVRRKTFKTAYPLHDGKWQWTEIENLNERQLLARYWANAKSWYYMQPLHIIYNYYGHEVAFRFAWLGYYNKMLIPAAAIGLLVFIFNWQFLRYPGNYRLKEICESNLMMCPSCMGSHCGLNNLSASCGFAKVTFVFDNFGGVLFAVLMSIWSTFFVEFWKRTEVRLLFEWNLLGADQEIQVLPQYEEKTRYRRISKNTGSMEAYVPLRIKIVYYSISCFVCFLMIMVVILTLLLNIIIGKLVKNSFAGSKTWLLKNYGTIIYMGISAIISVIFIRIYDPIFTKLIQRLTDMENHRTSTEYYNSYIIKNCVVNFCNNFLPLFYLSLMKEKLFTHPGDLKQYRQLLGLTSAVCHPSGCLSRVTVYLIFLMLIKKNSLKAIKHAIPHCKRMFKKAKKRLLHDAPSDTIVPQWEQEYELVPIPQLNFVKTMMERTLEYGLILFFASALPLLPLISVIGNIAELRIMAYNLVRHSRRPVPRRLPGLGAWNGIIAAITYFSIFFNALIIAFTTEFVPRELYRYKYGNLSGFINSTLSEFAIKDFAPEIRDRLQKSSNVTVCYYKGYREGPNEPNKYKLSDNHYYLLGMSLFMIIIFEHIVLILTGILAYAIPDIPLVIKEHLAYEEQQLIDARANSNDTGL